MSGALRERKKPGQAAPPLTSSNSALNDPDAAEPAPASPSSLCRRGLHFCCGLVAAGALAAAVLWGLAGALDPPPPDALAGYATVVDNRSLPAIEILGHRLHAEVLGDPSAPVVVVLHGGPGDDYRALLPLAPLADTHRIVLYDQRGAGLSQRVKAPAEDLTIDAYIAELDAVVRHYAGSEGRVHLIGHSWGAMLGAAYLGRHPDRVASAILVEPGFLTREASRPFVEAMAAPPPFGLIWRLLWTGFRTLHLQSPPDSHARFDWLALTGILGAPKAVFPLWRYFCNEDVATAHLPHWRFGSAASMAIQSYMLPDQSIDAGLDRGIPEFPRPVLLMAGECNTLIGPAHQRQYHLPLFRDAELVVVPRAGHTLIGEDPEATLAAVRAHLARAAGKTRAEGGGDHAK